MSAIAYDYGDYYANIPNNFLIDYCRRNGLNSANYWVEDRLDGSTGRRVFYIHPVADTVANADPAQATIVNLAPTDATITAEDLSQT